MRLNSISKRIWFGYFLVAGVLLLSGVLVSSQISRLADHSQRVKSSRAPTVDASFKLLNSINESQSSFQRWVILEDKAFLKHKNEIWNSEVNPAMETLKSLSAQWHDPESIESFQKILGMLDNFRVQQDTFINSMSAQSQRLKQEAYQTYIDESPGLRREIENLVARQDQLMNEDIAAQAALVESVKLSQVVLVSLGILMCLIIGVLMVRMITKPVSQTIRFADAIAAGNYDSDFDIGGSVEVDRLKSSLESMRTSMELQTWLDQAQIKFNQAIRGVSNVADLAKAAVEVLARQIRAEVGILYLVDGPKLKVAGGYALPREKHPDVEIEVGEGLAGQVASSGEMRSVYGAGNEALPLHTLLGDIQPQEALAVPLILRDQVIGVMEFALINRLRKRDQDFLKDTVSSLAVTLDSTIKNDQIQNLLHETQAQSEELREQQEELQTRQEELEATNEELEEQQALLTAQKKALDDRNQELDQISKYKSEFLANMSHELRTPLNSQLILSNLLIENKDGNLTDKQVQYLQTIHGTGISLLHLINDILDLSKVEAGKLGLDIQDVLLNNVIATLKNDFSASIQQKGLNFSIEIGPDVPSQLQTDPLRLNQILRNLISNALKFTEKGEISLRVENLSEGIAFHVKDTGIGIPEEKQKAIFEAFEQVDNSTSRQYGGTGLGLAISKNLSRLLGGRITLKSRIGEGSTFTLIVPKILESSLPGQKFIPPEENRAPQPTVIKNDVPTALVIEDDSSFAQTLGELVTQKGFRSLIAHDGAQGLKYAEDHLPSYILLDYQLPGLDGLQILRELKRNPATRHIPIYMISVEDHGPEALTLGAVGYLLKPAAPGEISEVLDQLESVANREIHRVLVVDDEQVQREEIIKLIGNGRVRSTGVATATAAYEALQGGESFDCMVLDLKLPDMSGFELLEKIRKDSSLKCPPVIVYTAKELTREEEDRLRKYSDSIIIKGARSSERLLDEVSLFIHRVVRELPARQQKMLNEFYNLEESFKDKKVLLVDDDVRNIFALCSALEEKGLDVVIARNGKEALDVLNENRHINLILMDVMMPVMDGYEAMKQIRKSAQYHSVPIIALTAKAMREDKELCLQAGASDYLAKPVDMGRLLTLLRVWLSK